MKDINKLVIYGDSISTMNYDCGGYGRFLGEMLDCKITNHAISGSGLGKNTPCSMVSVIDNPENLHSDADIIIVWHGTNDWYWGTPVQGDGNDCYDGGLRYVIEKLRNNSPDADIICMTPIFRLQAPDECDECCEAYDNPNKIGFTLKDYIDTLLEMSGKLCFPVVDLRTLTNFNAYNAYKYLPDNIHPSEEGHKRIANILANFIKENI